ncbi:hypothetical protein O6H91_14G070100 [Diphasiastrum complanatum]|uniref:Uncharacterized protein n=2 Tax=Diphasiastrum complanatum TaxID=34168 RepID=A0ACC2BQL6_DIPCM|nr:hypothetical protein O6H91_Y057300 [Diphasiastrum complanatum]KAJ7532050.1 hypothetical protein O6H91_14G070100 [Diphasiastrum complanatum]KAJ7532051.1 hypothetical protein O6H91_14G070100 [Diphasiastrum complanatum]
MEGITSFSVVLLVAAAALAIAINSVSAGDQNITTILDNYPQCSTFNNLLSKTGVASEINARNTITVLVPDNSVLDPFINSLGNKATDQQLADMLRYNVLLSYYDSTQLQQISNGTTLTPTLYQTTGRAVGQYGTVNITDEKGGKVGLGMPVSGGTLQTQIVKSMKDISFNISVLQISNVLVPEGVFSPVPAPAPVPVSPPAPAPAPVVAPTTAPKAGPSSSHPESPAGSSKPSGGIRTVGSVSGFSPVALLLMIISAALFQFP